MKAMKKSITLTFTLVMLLSCMVFPASAANQPFTDVPAGAWYAEYVQYVYENGVMNGTSATTFSPETKMDRAMLVTVLYRMDGSKEVSGSTPFTDIKTDGYYYTALLWAYQNGIINGTSATQFSPSMSITREMMVTIFYRYAQCIDRDVSKLDGLSGYTDAGSISGYAKTPFQWAVANGIITGVSSTALSPEGTATRAQCATILKRFCDWAEDNAGEDIEPDPTAPTEHTHSYTSRVTTEATCTRDGVRLYTCSCGDSYSEGITRLGHDYRDSVVAPTCKAEGYTAHTCSRCGSSYKDGYKAANGHSWGDWVTTKKPTTTSEGAAERKCSVCGTKETKSLPKVVEEHKHNYSGKVTTSATCTKDGVKTFTCSCGDSYTEAIPKNGHSWGNWVTTTEPTENSTGIAERTCSVCGSSETKVLDKIGKHSHSYKISGEVLPTCTEDGYYIYTCLYCTDSYTATSYKYSSGHNYSVYDSKEATCTEDGYTVYKCSGCGDTQTEPSKASHSWVTYTTEAEGYTEVWSVYDCGWRYKLGIYEEYLEIGDDAYDRDGRLVAYRDHVKECTDTTATHNYHSEGVWVETTPATSYSVCSVCGATK